MFRSLLPSKNALPVTTQIPSSQRLDKNLVSCFKHPSLLVFWKCPSGKGSKGSVHKANPGDDSKKPWVKRMAQSIGTLRPLNSYAVRCVHCIADLDGPRRWGRNMFFKTGCSVEREKAGVCWFKQGLIDHPVSWHLLDHVWIILDPLLLLSRFYACSIAE